MRRLAIVCVLFAATGRASAAPDPATTQPSGAGPVVPPDAPRPAPDASPEPAPPASPDTQPEPPPEPPPPAAPLPPPEPIDRALAEEQCAARDPQCDWVATLSSLERASVMRALTARGYQIDPAPWGKVIGRLHVYNEDVFAERTPLLQFFNIFHITTKESTIRSEAVVSPGERWEQARIDETARRLRDPLWTSVVAILPVQSTTPGAVDALIVTRDIWSLRLNTQYTYQQGKLTNLSMSLSENNLLGKRDVLAAAVTLDQGAVALGPLFIDKNLLGEHLDLRAQVNGIFNRDRLFDDGELHSEGTSSSFTLSRPLWSLASAWAAGASFSHRFAIDRQFRGIALRPYEYEDPETGEVTATFGREYKMRRWSASAYVTRQWGSRLKHQLSLGHSVDSVRPHVLGEFAGDAAQRAAFIADVLPRSELTSVPFVEYALFTPRYRTLRNVTTFALAEDLRTGPDLTVSLGFGLELLGSDHNFQRLTGSAGWTLPLARDGYVRASASVSGRYEGGEVINKSASGSLRLVAPPVRGVRFVAQSTLSALGNKPPNQFYAIGSDSGLRGFAINEFSGRRFFSTQLEARTLPYSLWVLRLGGVVFYDLGGAEDVLPRLELHQDAGLGFRMLIPQSSVQLFKFDFAFPFDGANRGTVRFLAGFGSEF